MLEMMEIGIDNAVAFSMSGKITERDMSLVLSDAKKKIEQHGNIVLLERIDSFEGIELSAIVEEFEYIFKVGIPDGHLKIPHLWPGQNPPPEVRSYPLSDRAK